MRNLNFSIYGSNLIDSFDFRTEPAVNAKNFVINDSSKRKIIKNFGTILPWISITIFLVDLIIETIDSCDLPRFVVSSKKSDSIRMFNF